MAREKGSGNLQRESSGRWTLRLCVGGQRFSKTSRTKNRELAEEELRRFVEEHGVARDSLTFKDSWAAYLASPRRRDLRLTTLEGKRQVWENFISWIQARYPGTNELREVTTDMAEGFLAYLRTDHAATTYNNRLCALREIFRVLKDKAGLVHDPWKGARLKPDDSHVRRPLTMKEVQRLVGCAKAVGDEWRKLFEIGIYTGLRLGDCCRLDWKTIDLERGIIQLIPRKTEKSAHGHPVTIPIHPALDKTLRETSEDERVGPVMPYVHDLYLESRTAVSYRLHKIFHNAGIVTSVFIEGRKWKAPEATFHSLRHTFVSLAANAGVPLHIVQSIVGHESTAMTRHYYHENEEVLRRAVASIPSVGEGKMPSGTKACAAQAVGGRVDPKMMGELKRMYEMLKGVFG